MSLNRKLRDAEKRGANAVHDVTKRLKSVVHTGRNKSQRPMSAHPDPEQEHECASNGQGRTGIISVNGCDVGEMRCNGGRRMN